MRNLPLTSYLSRFGKFPWLRNLSLLTLGSIVTITISLAAQAAKTIRFVYNSISLSIEISALQTYAEEGKVSKQLARYFDLAKANKETRERFRKALTTRVKIDPLLLSRALNTEEGERLLERLGKVINVPGGRNGKFSIRGAVVQSALEPEGLTLLNVLSNFSTDIQIDVNEAITVAGLIDKIIKGTYFLVEEVDNLTQAEALRAQPTDFSQLPDLRQPGRYQVEKQRWNLTDPERDRRFYVDVYKPRQWRSNQNPVIIISHGLSSKPEHFDERAEHLATYGYLVALPQHPGSDEQQTKDFLEGTSRQIFQRNEFIDRPLDISYTLDELERRNSGEFEGKLDLDNVGVFGHSFGGYTTLALAGATPDFGYLERYCSNDLGQFNTAILLQCRALKLEQKDYNFRDERVKAVYTINPVNRAIFGPQGLGKIKIPVFMAAGNYDPATPFAFEQAASFPNLTEAAHKYLQLQEGQAHVDFSELDAGITKTLKALGKLTLPNPRLLDDYTNSMMLAFFEVYISENKDYEPFLQSTYAVYLSEDQDFKTALISEASAEELNQAIDEFLAKNNLRRIE